MACGQVEANAHRAWLWIGEVLIAVVHVVRTGCLGHERIHRHPHQLVARIAEEQLRLCVRIDDGAVAVREDEGVGGELDERAKECIREWLIRHVIPRCCHAPPSSGTKVPSSAGPLHMPGLAAHEDDIRGVRINEVDGAGRPTRFPV